MRCGHKGIKHHEQQGNPQEKGQKAESLEEEVEENAAKT